MSVQSDLIMRRTLYLLLNSFELINILKMNNMKTPNVKSGDGAIGRKSKDLVKTLSDHF